MTAYTNSLRLTLPVTGTDDGTWGETVNDGITSLVDASIAGTATVAHDDTANYTLTDNDGATDEARQMFLNITGALTAARNVVCPGVSKLYFITNNTTGGYAVTLKTSGGTGISVANGASAALYCNGTNVVYAFDQVNLQPTVSIAGNMDSGTTDYAVSATPAVQSNVTAAANIFYTAPTTEADTFTLPYLRHFYAVQGTFGAGSTVTGQYGFVASSNLTGAQLNVGFQSNIDSKTALTISTMNGSGTTVTVDTTTSHGLANNDYVFINLVPQTTMTSGSYNGYYQVTVVDAETFTYSSSATSSAPVTSGYVTPAGRWNFFSNGTGQNRFDGSVIIGTSSYVDALRITQTGAGNALLVEDSTNPDSTPFVIDASGNVITGSTSQITDFVNYVGTSVLPKFELVGTGISATSIAQAVYAAVNAAPTIVHAKSRNATIGSHTVVNSGETIGAWVAQGSDGTSFLNAGSIRFEIDGTPGTNDMPGRLVFSTTADGASAPTEALRINSSGNVIVGSGEASSSPVGNVLRGPNGSGTNIAGGKLDIYSGIGTGTGQGGNIGFFTSGAPGSSGTTQNVTVERMRIYSSSTAADGPKGIHVAFSGNFPSTVPLSGLNGTYTPFTINGVNEETASIGIINWGVSSADEAVLCFSAMNSGTVGSYGTALTSGTNIGTIEFDGYSGTGTSSGMVCGASIFVEAYGGTWSATSAPSRILISCGSTTETSVNRLELAANNFSMLTGTGLTIAETAITTGSSAVGNVFSGTYTPTLTNTTNVAASTPYLSQYMRVGNVVTVSGRMNIDPTAASTASEIAISLPIASDITANSNLGGTGAVATTAAEVSSGGILGDTTNNRATFRFTSGGTAARDYYYTFTYLVQ